MMRPIETLTETPMTSIPDNLTRKLQDQPYMVTRFDAAKLLGISVPTIDRMVAAKTIPSRNVRGRRMFSTHTLRRWAQEQEAE